MNKLEEPELGGGIDVSEWLRQIAEGFLEKGANTRAAEAERIADWLDELSYGEGLRALALEDGETVTRQINDIRDLRSEIAEVQLRSLRDSYPEIQSTKVEPLTDTKIVIAALDREARAHQQIIADLDEGE